MIASTVVLIVEAGLRSLLLGVVVWLAMLVLRPRNPHLQKTIWITVLVASLVMPFVLKTRMAPSFDVPTTFAALTQSVDASAHTAPISAMQWAFGAITAAPRRTWVARVRRAANSPQANVQATCRCRAGPSAREPFAQLRL